MSVPPLSSRYLPCFAVFEREIRRFFSVPAQTIFGPMGSSFLYFIIFHFSIGKYAESSGDTSRLLSHGVPYLLFLIPGIMTMEIINASFQNPVSSLLIAKWTGTIIDQLLAPLSPRATWVAYLGGALVRALLVSTSAYIAGAIFTRSLPIHNIFLFLYAIVCATTIFGSLGIIAGIRCKNFDHVSMITTLCIQPLVFWSGVFFSFQQLPDAISWLPYVNPIFYLVNLFRFAIIGICEVPLVVAMLTSFVFAAVLGLGALVTLSKGKGLRV